MSQAVTQPDRAGAARDTPLARVHSLPDDRVVRAEPTESIPQRSRRSGIPHTSVRGGNARCSTCRVIVAILLADVRGFTAFAGNLPPAAGDSRPEETVTPWHAS